MTETQVIDASDPAEQNKIVDLAVGLLEKGEVVALPTETVYGLGADAVNSEAVAKIFAAKQRPSFDPLIVHVGSYEQVDEVADVPDELREVIDKLMKAHWPGPLTLILPKKECVPDIVTSGLPSVAVRMSAPPLMKAIIRKLGRPIAAPSANRFGRISQTSASAVEKELSGLIPMIIDGGACREGIESTIIRPEISADAGKKGVLIHVLRAGPVIPPGGSVWPAAPSASAAGFFSSAEPSGMESQGMGVQESAAGSSSAGAIAMDVQEAAAVSSSAGSSTMAAAAEESEAAATGLAAPAIQIQLLQIECASLLAS